MSRQLEDMLIAKQITPTSMRLLVLEFLLNQTSAVSLGNLENEFEYADRITL